MKKIMFYVKFWGLWIFPVVICGGALLCHKLHPQKAMQPLEWVLLFIISATIALFIWNSNDIRIKNGKRKEDIHLTDTLFRTTPESFDEDDGKEKYMYPPIDSRMLFESPEDCFYLIGRAKSNGKNQYVGIPDDTPGAKHILIAGGTGSGKSSTQIIPFLLNNAKRKKCGKGNVNCLVLDPKGELARLTEAEKHNEIIIDPGNRNRYGYDPFYSLSEDSTEQEMYDVAYIVTISLIPKPGAKIRENGPWIPLAQDMLIGFIIFCYKYKKIKFLPQMIQFILSKQVEELVAEACAEVEPNGNVAMHLTQFLGMSAETLYSVTATLFPKIKSFATDQNLVYALGTNPKKFRPEDLLFCSAFISIPLDKIAQYGQLIFLLINQFSLWLFTQNEKSLEQYRADIVLVLDETTAIFQALGAVPDQYTQLLRYGRSYGFSCITAVQSIAGLKTILDDSSCDDLLSNMPYKIFLDCCTEQKQLIEWVGKFPSKHTTYNGIGKERTKSITFSDEDILSASEVQKLGLSDELISISALSGYTRIKKNPWYRDSYFL